MGTELSTFVVFYASVMILYTFVYTLVGEVSALSQSFNERQRRIHTEGLEPNHLDIFVKRCGSTLTATLICLALALI
jgi:flagellar biosynthesis protein FlhB